MSLAGIDTQTMQWKACRACGTSNTQEVWRRQVGVCPHCNHHRRIGLDARIQLIADEHSFIEQDADLQPQNPLDWREGAQSYPDMVAQAAESTGIGESFRYGNVKIGGTGALLGGFEFAFLGGTLGSVAGEKVARMLESAIAQQCPAIIFTASGGARMQEGMISLMQMSKIATCVAALNRASVPLITVICDPTTGGVAASLAFMGDLVLAEPGALAGFAGPRVILQTIGEEMPADVQTTDRLCRDGFVDEIVPRLQLRDVLVQRLRALSA